MCLAFAARAAWSRRFGAAQTTSNFNLHILIERVLINIVYINTHHTIFILFWTHKPLYLCAKHQSENIHTYTQPYLNTMFWQNKHDRLVQIN